MDQKLGSGGLKLGENPGADLALQQFLAICRELQKLLELYSSRLSDVSLPMQEIQHYQGLIQEFLQRLGLYQKVAAHWPAEHQNKAQAELEQLSGRLGDLERLCAEHRSAVGAKLESFQIPAKWRLREQSGGVIERPGSGGIIDIRS